MQNSRRPRAQRLRYVQPASQSSSRQRRPPRRWCVAGRKRARSRPPPLPHHVSGPAWSTPAPCAARRSAAKHRAWRALGLAFGPCAGQARACRLSDGGARLRRGASGERGTPSDERRKLRHVACPGPAPKGARSAQLTDVRGAARAAPRHSRGCACCTVHGSACSSPRLRTGLRRRAPAPARRAFVRVDRPQQELTRQTRTRRRPSPAGARSAATRCAQLHPHEGSSPLHTTSLHSTRAAAREHAGRSRWHGRRTGSG